MSGVSITRKTVKEAVKLEGRGLHSGEPVEVTVNPGEAGIAFRLGKVRVQAVPENVTETSRCTRLGDVSTIEHMMSALAALEITDAEVELTGAELPGLDGSAGEFLTSLASGGFADVGPATVFPPFKRVFLQEDQVSLAAALGDGKWRYEYLTGERWPNSQLFETENVIGDYREQIGSARTFALVEELPYIQAMGLGRGLDETSALILGKSGYENPARFPDEPARHKLLDLIGDLYLSGIPIRYLNVVGVRSGHRANVAFAKLLAESARRGAAGQEEHP